MARDQRNYREIDKARRRAERHGGKPELALAADGFVHQATGASMPYTLCGKKVLNRVVGNPEWLEAEGDRCPECSDLSRDLLPV